MDMVSPRTLEALGYMPSLLRSASSVVVASITTMLSLASTMVATGVALLRFSLIPVSWLWRVVFVLLSPVLYTTAYVLSPAWYIVSFLPKLQPLYIYFGSAAFVGVIAGLSIKLSSHLFVSVLELDKESPPSLKQIEAQRQKKQKQKMALSAATTPTAQQTPTIKRASDYYSGSLSSDIDWQIIDRITNRGLHSEHSRRMPLLQSIILEEEEDDTSGGD
ncbi:hypothetical protein MCOR25_009243 [Pyricularia grisea]|uniref:Uncharacterized protein n=1 Tax=Pyricularia grisea TaxID=148305 RepID=A0A6P8B6K9_PYRGI|nr:hypothetical protein PgNI_06011 [Pyricularia grisea]KAI6352954.1 hypothetical protein MCOR25_009243 [Pyricularia grisea]TLD10956.1 hypothetical protein PgNI_06011 [Pyricularia grisea]